MRKIYTRQSLWSKLINFMFFFTSSKHNSSSEEAAKKFIEKSSRLPFNEKIYKDFKRERFSNYDVYAYNGSIDSCKKKILIYVHGGNFVEHASKFLIRFAKKVAKLTDSTLLVPIYELLPNGNSQKMADFLLKLYEHVASLHDCEINLLGDSAGGGAILYLAMQIRDNNLRSPQNIVMLSPWLDLSMSNPDLYKDAKSDRMNSVDGIRYEGKLWACGLDVYSPSVSPMYGNFDNLGKMSIIFGGRGILSSECKRFDKILSDHGIEHNFFMYEKEGHDFAAYPTLEGGKAINDIVNIINCDNDGL